MRLIAYARVSTDDQADNGHSLSQQVDRLRAEVQARGHTLVDTLLDEGISGSMPLQRRPGGKRLLDALRANHADGVVVVRLDRLFRDTFDGLRYFDERRDAQVVSLTEAIDTRTPQGRFFLTQLLAMAQYERDMAAERARDCNTALRKSGKVFGGTPYACIRVDLVNGSGDASSTLLRDPLLWPARCRIVELRSEGMSLRGIVDQLIRERVPTPGGKRRWSTATLSNVIKTHDDLTHLPLAKQAASAPAVAHDAEVSRALIH